MSNLTMFRGNTPTFQITASSYSGDPISLAGAYIFFTVKEKFSDAEPLFQKELGDGITVVDESNGVFNVRLDTEDTALITRLTKLKYDVQVVDSFGDITTLEVGNLMVRPDITG